MALRAFLEERAFRRVIREGDRLVLVGHSTGGLDLRQLLVNLNPAFEAALRDVAVDTLITDRALLSLVKGLVFLSVPQRGTNIADYIRRMRPPLEALLNTAQTALKLSHNDVLDDFERWLLTRSWLPDETPQLIAAIRDAILETLPGDHNGTPLDRYRDAIARTAYGELLAWLDHVSSDFFAIDDLAFEAKPDAWPSPARYDEALRQQERAAWQQAGIATRSFATIGRAPYDRRPRTRAYTFLSQLRLLLNLRPDNVARTDFVYRFAHAATAAGPFSVTPAQARVGVAGQIRVIEPHENDGIVNTASMLWPDGEQTTLVAADHGDIIGHYFQGKPVKECERIAGRRNHSYDILRSGSGFETEAQFDDVWHAVFDFSAAVDVVA
jgi:hypothetical protein